jgi:hypothetical protein
MYKDIKQISSGMLNTMLRVEDTFGTVVSLSASEQKLRVFLSFLCTADQPAWQAPPPGNRFRQFSRLPPSA